MAALLSVEDISNMTGKVTPSISFKGAKRKRGRRSEEKIEGKRK